MSMSTFRIERFGDFVCNRCDSIAKRVYTVKHVRTDVDHHAGWRLDCPQCGTIFVSKSAKLLK